MSDLRGRTVVVTGAASGIGKALVEGFLREGATVVGADINEAGLAAIAEHGAVTSRTDVSVDTERRALELAKRSDI